MPDAPRAARGRPKLASPALLEEAAFELFLENGYAGTTIEQITTRAGVSRNTFFNYFHAKSDVFWVGLDASIERLGGSLWAGADASGRPGSSGSDGSAASPGSSASPGLSASPASPGLSARRALLEAADELGPSDVPWVLTHFELIGSTHEVMASAIGRASRLSQILEGAGLGRSLAFACVGAIVAAMQSWAEAGPRRGTLAAHLDAALGPILPHD